MTHSPSFLARSGSSVYRPGGYALVVMAFLLALATWILGWPHVAVVSAMVSLVGLVIAQWQAFLVIGYSIYGLLGALFSVWMIERGAYISEQFRYGADIGAANALAVMCILFWAFAHISVVFLTRKFYGINSSPRRNGIFKVTLFLLVSAVIIYGLVLALVGSAWNLPGARFELMRSIPGWLPPFVKLFRYYLVPAAFAAVGMCLALQGWSIFQRISVLVLSALIFIMQFFMGDKLSGFIVIATFLAAGYGLMSIWKGTNIHISAKVLPMSIVTLVSGIGVAALGYSAAGKENVWVSIADRLVLQGHIWFGIYEIATPFGEILPVSLLLTKTFEQSAGGLDALSLLVAPADFVWTRIELGIGFTMGGSAAAIASVGIIPGIGLYALSAVGYGLVAWMIMTAMEKRRWYFVVGLTTYFFILAQVTQMGNWYFLKHPVALLCYAGLFLLLLLPSRQEEDYLEPNLDDSGRKLA